MGDRSLSARRQSSGVLLRIRAGRVAQFLRWHPQARADFGSRRRETMKASQAATLVAGTLDIGKGEWGPLLTVCGIIFAAAMVSGLLPFAFAKVRWMDKVTAVGAG